MKTLQICFFCLLLFQMQLSGQALRALSIGDTMPAMEPKEIYSRAGATLSGVDLKGKVVIFDFWDIWCSSCILAFPKMEHLQNKFGRSVQIVMVTKNKESEVARLFGKIKMPDLPIITDDTVLSRLFPYNTVPHHVWISPGGLVKYITDGYNATEENIAALVEGKNLQLHQKSELSDFDLAVPLWSEGNGRLQKYMKGYSYVMTRIEEYAGGSYSLQVDSLSNTVSFKFVNIPILNLYKAAFGQTVDCLSSEFARTSRILFLTRRKGDFDSPIIASQISQWRDNNLICYESKWPITSRSLAFAYLQSDLNRLLPFRVAVEYVTRPCYVLVRNKNRRNIISSKAVSKFEMNDSSLFINKKPVSVLVSTLDYLPLFDSIPLMDDTNIKGNISIRLENAFTRISSLRAALIKSGFDIKKKTKKIRMLVIRDKVKEGPI